MGIRLWKVGVRESKISCSKHKFLLQKRRKRNIFLKHVLIWNLNLHHCLSPLQPSLETAKSAFIWIAERAELVNSLWQEHHQLVETCLLTIKYLSPLSSDVHWKISHMHPVATSTFKQSWFILSVIRKTSKVYMPLYIYLYIFISKSPSERLTSWYPSSCIFNDVRPGAWGKITVVARG